MSQYVLMSVGGEDTNDYLLLSATNSEEISMAISALMNDDNKKIDENMRNGQNNGAIKRKQKKAIDRRVSPALSQRCKNNKGKENQFNGNTNEEDKSQNTGRNSHRERASRKSSPSSSWSSNNRGLSRDDRTAATTTSAYTTVAATDTGSWTEFTGKTGSNTFSTNSSSAVAGSVAQPPTAAAAAAAAAVVEASSPVPFAILSEKRNSPNPTAPPLSSYGSNETRNTAITRAATVGTKANTTVATTITEVSTSGTTSSYDDPSTTTRTTTVSIERAEKTDRNSVTYSSPSSSSSSSSVMSKIAILSRQETFELVVVSSQKQAHSRNQVLVSAECGNNSTEPTEMGRTNIPHRIRSSNSAATNHTEGHNSVVSVSMNSAEFRNMVRRRSYNSAVSTHGQPRPPIHPQLNHRQRELEGRTTSSQSSGEKQSARSPIHKPIDCKDSATRSSSSSSSPRQESCGHNEEEVTTTVIKTIQEEEECDDGQLPEPQEQQQQEEKGKDDDRSVAGSRSTTMSERSLLGRLRNSTEKRIIRSLPRVSPTLTSRQSFSPILEARRRISDKSNTNEEDSVNRSSECFEDHGQEVVLQGNIYEQQDDDKTYIIAPVGDGESLTSQEDYDGEQDFHSLARNNNKQHYSDYSASGTRTSAVLQNYQDKNSIIDTNDRRDGHFESSTTPISPSSSEVLKKKTRFSDSILKQRTTDSSSNIEPVPSSDDKKFDDFILSKRTNSSTCLSTEERDDDSRDCNYYYDIRDHNNDRDEVAGGDEDEEDDDCFSIYNDGVLSDINIDKARRRSWHHRAGDKIHAIIPLVHVGSSCGSLFEILGFNDETYEFTLGRGWLQDEDVNKW